MLVVTTAIPEALKGGEPGTAEFREGLDALLEKRPARFTDKRNL